MNRIFATALAIAISFAIAPRLRAAPLRTEAGFAFTENALAGTHFWCSFPVFPSQWTVVLYERRLQEHTWPARRYIYVPLVHVTKTPAESGSALYKMMTVPPHTGGDCLLAAFRNGVQQPYRGWTKYNPFGWHTFGVVPPIEALVAEIPPGTPDRDIRSYQRSMRQQWSMPPKQ